MQVLRFSLSSMLHLLQSLHILQLQLASRGSLPSPSSILTLPFTGVLQPSSLALLFLLLILLASATALPFLLPIVRPMPLLLPTLLLSQKLSVG